MAPRISTLALWRSFRRMLTVFALLLLLMFGTGVAVVLQAGRSEVQPADAAVVMLGDTNSSTVRLDRARQLYSEGKVSRILLAGTDLGDSRATLLQRGVKEDAIIDLIEPGQVSQLAAVKRTLDQESLKNAVLIAEPIETLRLLKIARDDGIRPFSTPIGAEPGISISGVIREVGRYFRYVLLNR